MGRQVSALGELLVDGVRGGATRVEEMHRAIAGRSFDAVGPGSEQVRAIHDGVAAGTYGAVRELAGVLGRAASVAIEAAAPEAAPLSRSRAGEITLGTLNGVVGDVLEARRSELAMPMAIRHEGADVALETGELERAFPGAGGRLALFVHGLCESDEAWRLFADRNGGETYGSRLRRDLGYTPVYVRYNSGLHVSQNGRRLCELLERAVSRWPEPVTEIVLVGHSMGGLVVRSACHYGSTSGSRWVKSVRHVFCLGAPHLGTPLEKAANVAGWALDSFPETRALATVLNTRSAGIKDLRYGYCVDEDWADRDSDALLEDHRCDIPLLEGARHYFVAATVTRDADGLLGRLVGDLMVRYPSASGTGGRGRHIPFQLEDGCHLGGVNHYQLVNHPAVYEQIRARLG